jgi:D-alanyl-D-alanine carboxypeptidase/D-alanyl-D-alanine-endopeptidase (penicillin-binding protein 4)
VTRRLAACLTASALALAAPAAWARVPDKTPRRHLEAEIRRAIGGPAARGATPGVLVLRAGRPIIEIQADRPFVPASLMKLATTVAAVLRFGPDHRFATRVLARLAGPGVARGLVLVGGGDPTLATDAYRRERFLPKPDDPAPRPAFTSGSPTVEALAAAVAARGIRRVEGDLVVDDALFDAARTQPGWIPDYQRGEPDVGNIAALTVNEGFADLSRRRLLADPALGAGAALRAALAARGIAVAGGVRRGRAGPGLTEVARVLSPPLAEIVDYTNRYSVNYPAELLLKGLGAAFGGAGTTAAGVRVVRDTLTGIGIPLDGFVMADGSGLSLDDRMTPRTVAALVEWIVTASGPAGEALRDSLPVAGGPGTLLRRMTRPPTAGNLHGKTGSTRGVRAMAGWVTPADGARLTYVAVFNEAPRPSLLTAPLDVIGTALALFAG